MLSVHILFTVCAVVTLCFVSVSFFYSVNIDINGFQIKIQKAGYLFFMCLI